jgi:hypothetical protein
MQVFQKGGRKNLNTKANVTTGKKEYVFSKKDARIYRQCKHENKRCKFLKKDTRI